MIFGVRNPAKKFVINSLYTCPPCPHTVATLTWEIQKSHFSTVSFKHTSDYLRYLEKKQTATVCTATYLFTYCCLLLAIICVALFYGQYFFLFGQSFSKPPMPTHNRLFSDSRTLGGTQHYLQSDVKVLHFTR